MKQHQQPQPPQQQQQQQQQPQQGSPSVVPTAGQPTSPTAAGVRSAGFRRGDQVWAFYRCSQLQAAGRRRGQDAPAYEDHGPMDTGAFVTANRQLQSDNGWTMAQGEKGLVVGLDHDKDPVIMNAAGEVSPEPYYSADFSLMGLRQRKPPMRVGAQVVAQQPLQSENGWRMQAFELGVISALDRDGDPFVRNAAGEQSPEAYYSRDFYPTGQFAAAEPTVAALCAAAGLSTPRIGRSDGWMEAVVIEDWDPAEYEPAGAAHTGVRVRFMHRHWLGRSGERSDAPYECVVPPDSISTCRPSRPVVSFVVLRWGGERSCDPVHEGAGGWGRTGSMVSDPYIQQFFDEAVYKSLGANYEALTVFVRDDEDCRKVQAPLLAGLLSGYHFAGLYFLWPVHYRSCDDYPGYVPQNAVLSLMADMENAGVATRFPHHSHLYRLLLSKDWMCHLCLDPQYKVPPSTKVSRVLIEKDPLGAARQAAAVLRRLRRARGMPDRPPRGVAKLGFSWEATDVRKFDDEEQLAMRLVDLATQKAAMGLNAVMVQDWVDFSLELRLFFIDPKPEWDEAAGAPAMIAPRQVLYTRFLVTQERNGCFTDFDRLTRAKAISLCMQGDKDALKDAEDQCAALGSRALFWLQTECAEPPPVLRIDFMVRRADTGRAEVALGELTELGGCFLGWQQGPRHVWGAAVRSCFRIGDGTLRMPQWVRSPAADL